MSAARFIGVVGRGGRDCENISAGDGEQERALEAGAEAEAEAEAEAGADAIALSRRYLRSSTRRANHNIIAPHTP